MPHLRQRGRPDGAGGDGDRIVEILRPDQIAWLVELDQSGLAAVASRRGLTRGAIRHRVKTLAAWLDARGCNGSAVRALLQRRQARTSPLSQLFGEDLSEARQRFGEADLASPAIDRARVARSFAALRKSV